VKSVSSERSVRSVADDSGRTGRWRVAVMAIIEDSERRVAGESVEEEAESSWMGCRSQGQGPGGGQTEQRRWARGRESFASATANHHRSDRVPATPDPSPLRCHLSTTHSLCPRI
jgi:hypothetical protein